MSAQIRVNRPPPRRSDEELLADAANLHTAASALLDAGEVDRAEALQVRITRLLNAIG